jgi:general stress protein 26
MNSTHPVPTAQTHADAVAKLATLISKIQFCMFTTVEDDGALRSRPMATQQTEFDGTLWFFTGASTHKITEISRDQHVNLSYSDPDNNRYVSVSGTAQMVRDSTKAKELWNPAYKAWFPEGLSDPDLALLKVEVDHAEYWDSPASSVVYIVGFLKAIATGKRLENAGEHEKLQL